MAKDTQRDISGAYEHLMSLSDGMVAPSSDQGKSNQVQLEELIESLIDSGVDDPIKQACWHPNSLDAGRVVRQATDNIFNLVQKESLFQLDLFVIPIILVVGSQKNIRLSTVMRDVGVLQDLFEDLGVLGHCKNFGLANSLTDHDVLNGYPLKSWKEAGRYHSSKKPMTLDFSECPVEVRAGSEAAQLRFLCGVSLSPSSAPSIFESAGNIGRWGIKFAEALSQQISTEDCSILAIPRPPMPLIKSLEEGYWSVREVGFQLFASNAINHARLKFGEADISIDSSAGGKVLVRLSSLFDDSFDRTFDFPVAPYESHEQVLSIMDHFFRDIGVQRYQLKSADNSEIYVNCEG